MWDVNASADPQTQQDKSDPVKSVPAGSLPRRPEVHITHRSTPDTPITPGKRKKGKTVAAATPGPV